MPNIVISYRRDDSKWIADRVFDRFESHYGKGNVFMDIDSIPFGLDFREHIRETLDRCDVMVALVGPNWVGSDSTGDHILRETDWVRIEIEAALNKKIPLIPLLIDGSQMPKADELPEALKNFVFRQSAAIDRDNFRAQMDKVIASIDQHLAKIAQTPRRDLLSKRDSGSSAQRTWQTSIVKEPSIQSVQRDTGSVDVTKVQPELRNYARKRIFVGFSLIFFFFGLISLIVGFATGEANLQLFGGLGLLIAFLCGISI